MKVNVLVVIINNERHDTERYSKHNDRHNSVGSKQAEQLQVTVQLHLLECNSTIINTYVGKKYYPQCNPIAQTRRKHSDAHEHSCQPERTQ